MINVTGFIEQAGNFTTDQLITEASREFFLTPIVMYFLLSLILLVAIGMMIVETPQGRKNLWAIIFFTKMIEALILFFTFAIPVIPQIIMGWFG